MMVVVLTTCMIIVAIKVEQTYQLRPLHLRQAEPSTNLFNVQYMKVSSVLYVFAAILK